MFVSHVPVADARPVPFTDTSSRAQLGRHQCSVGALSRILAAALGLDEARCAHIGKAAALHDVGKLYVPAMVTEKRGPHDADDILAMHRHPLFGHAHLRAFRQTPVVKLAAMIALQHHEKFDGSGYPFGLSGDRIGIESRIVAICDVYDALREARPYRTGIGHDAALQVITCGDGRTRPSMFDPVVLNAMTSSQERIRAAFASRHPDNRL